METLESIVVLASDVHEAANRIKEVVHQTPLMTNYTASEKYGANILLKREDLQSVRSYKIRGAYNKISNLSETEKQKKIVCASAGNHAQGVALSCSKLKLSGLIFMPSPTPKQKISQVEMFGKGYVEIVLTGDTFDDANEAALRYVDNEEGIFIPPFDDWEIITGQATVGKEILEQSDTPIDYLFLPVGGGGLAAGVSSYLKQLSPNTTIVGVEPKGAPSMTIALETGMPVKLERVDKFVDGASVQLVGSKTFEICKDTLDQMSLVDEGAVCSTILELYNKEAIVVEPAGALSIAALEQFKKEIKGKNIVCVVSGSNNDITRMEEIKERSLLYDGLKHYFLVKFPQRAGALKEFVTDVLGPTDDITYFEYYKKVNKEQGPAVVGIELQNSQDLLSLKHRMEKLNFFEEYLNDRPDLLRMLV